MELFQLFVFSLCVPTLSAYVCRLTMLSVRYHDWRVILLHVALAMATAWAGYRAFLGDADFGDMAEVVGALTWIWISYTTWNRGVPEHFKTHLRPLDSTDLRKATGGKK